MISDAPISVFATCLIVLPMSMSVWKIYMLLLGRTVCFPVSALHWVLTCHTAMCTRRELLGEPGKSPDVRNRLIIFRIMCQNI
jgi:hypothetical protein